jgi:MoaA/NifB/PqqE/SkfB family radical SAM enzyme
MNLNGFLNGGIMRIADTAARFYLGDRRGQAFLLGAVGAFRKSARIREQYEKSGTHIPPFLIASVASRCNLHCAGCYARATGGCGESKNDLSADDWRRIFAQAEEIGVSFILLAGGEPLMNRDIIEAAADFPRLVFPIFTNGTLIDEAYIDLFDAHRNLVPVLSLEGDAARTDARRGAGVAEKVRAAAETLKSRGILYGASITVTRANMREVTEPAFARALREDGCGVAFYVEYVPAEKNTEHLVLTKTDLAALQERVDALREDVGGMIILSFPGDEEAMGGCLAAGRGFFHINSAGGAEPCPFSPFSNTNLREHALLDAIRSEFFAAVRAIGAAEAQNHAGGCALFNRQSEVAAFLK